jgi:cytochrome c-type biogenesis protein CcmH
MVRLPRREFLIGATGLTAAALARGLGAQQGSNFTPMDQQAYRPVLRTPKADAAPKLTTEERDALEKTLKCQCTCILDVYTCRTTDFTCSVSPAMHRDVMRLIEGGYDAQEIKTAFVDTYGEVALTAPVKQGFNWLGYLAPGIVLATGGMILTVMLRRWSMAAAWRTPAGTPGSAARDSIPAGTTSDELARLERALREEG